ncbi:MAG TPA: hypothetical protein VK436_05665 [Methanocella sp.]|nr:hypothetical protein [Methanocella sp.]
MEQPRAIKWNGIETSACAKLDSGAAGRPQRHTREFYKTIGHKGGRAGGRKGGRRVRELIEKGREAELGMKVTGRTAFHHGN